MGYGNGIADPMEMIRLGELGEAQGKARVANARAAEAERVSWEWKHHAEKIKQELRESMRSQWELAHQRDGWQKVAVHFWKKYAPDQQCPVKDLHVKAVRLSRGHQPGSRRRRR